MYIWNKNINNTNTYFKVEQYMKKNYDLPERVWVSDSERVLRESYLNQLWATGVDEYSLGIFNFELDLLQLAEMTKICEREYYFSNYMKNSVRNWISGTLFDSYSPTLIEFYHTYMEGHPYENALRFTFLECSTDWLNNTDGIIEEREFEKYLIIHKEEPRFYERLKEAFLYCYKLGVRLAYRVKGTWYFNGVLVMYDQAIIVDNEKEEKKVFIDDIEEFYITNLKSKVKRFIENM